MTDLWDEQKAYRHGTFVLHILKGTLLTPITEAHTMVVRQIYNYYRKLRCRELHHFKPG